MAVLPSVLLYVPGNDSRKLAKTSSLEAPGFILDLEDAVPPEGKHGARALVHTFLTEAPPPDRRFFVRVNPARSPYLWQDLTAIVTPHLAGVVIPKVESSEDVRTVDFTLQELEQEHSLQLPSLSILALIETARGIEALPDIAAAGGRLRALAFGAADLSRDLGLPWPPAPDAPANETLLMARARLVLVSRAEGLLPPHDGAYPRLQDPDGLAREAATARRMGFGGKHAIHPEQVPVLRAAFRPTAVELEWARRVLAAFSAAEARGEAVAVVDGALVDAPIVARARAYLAAAED